MSSDPLRDSSYVPAPSAPGWHTAALVTLIVLVAAVGSIMTASGTSPAPPSSNSRLTSIYAPLLAVEWGLLFYVCRIGRTHGALRALVGRRWDSGGRVAGDVLLALGTGLCIEGLGAAYTHLLGAGPNASVARLLPNTEIERAAWIVVAVSVGFCEEMIYRGYLQSELAARAKSMTVGVIAQAALFGLAHVDQGLRGAAPLVVYGLVLGVLARARRSLLPGVLCHVGVDLASGLLRH